MPELVEQMYCSQQIVIPPKFPYILKRYCKAAIKTQPYDLLRWSFEYFKALSERRPPPVKLRLEYPIYSTEGGLTRGCLKVLANQLNGMKEVPLRVARAAWQGFCLDPEEFNRILCLCEVYMREENVPFLNFIAVAAGMLTKSLTHTMILLCETLTKEPDGASAAICVYDFLVMYRFLAKMDASKDVKYINGYREERLWKCLEAPALMKEQDSFGITRPSRMEGASAAICVYDFLVMYRFLAQMDASKDFKYINGYREGTSPPSEHVEEEEPPEEASTSESEDYDLDFWGPAVHDLQKVKVINDHMSRTNKLSEKLNMPVLGMIERSPSAERDSQIERENYMRDRKDKPIANDEIDAQLRGIDKENLANADKVSEPTPNVKDEPSTDNKIQILVYDEEDKIVPYEIHGEPKYMPDNDPEEDEFREPNVDIKSTNELAASVTGDTTRSSITALGDEVKIFVNTLLANREERQEDLLQTFDEIAQIVDRFNSANYDLGMVAGRQMSTTSGEFIVAQLEREIMNYIDEQIEILPDPDLKKKKAKPEEVAMIREILEEFLDENMQTIVPELVEEEEEEEPVPEIIQVYAVPGIGPPVDDEIIRDVEEYALDACKVQADLFMPRNIRHFMCPPLEKFEEYQYEGDVTSKFKKEEGLAVGGRIAD